MMDFNEWNKKEKSGFVDIEQKDNCMSNEHFPPTHSFIPYGKKYVHIGTAWSTDMGRAALTMRIAA